mmetsp:Transcript_164/g.367  ORF Transcript_164/g.367 Transcript_164/m.367 type:complete len:113 (+) Transcript_164:2095-2433(+)
MVVTLLPSLSCSPSKQLWTVCSETLSREEVASSSSKTCGFFASARAIARRCFWPPDIWPPVAPTNVSNLSGKVSKKLRIPARRAASMAWSSVMEGSPALMLASTEAAKRTGS